MLLQFAALLQAPLPQVPPATPPPPAAPRAAVVTIALDAADAGDRDFLAVAKAAAKFHGAPQLAWDGTDDAALRTRLLGHGSPPAVLFFVRPERFDVTLHRRILLALAGLDDDPCADAAFGYLTARDGKALAALWARTEELHRQGLRGRIWHSAGVASGMQSTIYRGHRSELERAAGFAGDSYYFGIVEQDPDVRAFVRRALPQLAQANVLEWSGNGDPQGIWLFDGDRNLQREKHWDYEPGKVGQDPGGAMPRLLAADVRTMQLPGTIVWSGTCHAAATHRVVLEGDIVSTFGRAERGTVHLLPLDQSLGLSFLDAGAVALLAPVGPNHGMSAMRESEFALREGASLGEAVKSSWDDVLLAARGPLRLDLVEGGKFVDRGEHVMQGGGANRVLLGDPTLRPFAATRDPREQVAVERTGGGAFTVRVDWAQGFHARAWDMYGTDRERGACVPVRVAVDGLLPAGCTAVRAEAAATGAGGEVLPFAMAHAVLERFAGRRFLHLQANAPRAAVDGQEQHVVFRVAPAR
ncbi:MAG: hypothetical protein FJ265_00720 [Planctomycetes bacterium]|nr:hypothetical protein [Planctomycetota bacterium]